MSHAERLELLADEVHEHRLLPARYQALGLALAPARPGPRPEALPPAGYGYLD